MHSDKELGQMALILLFSRSIGILWVMISFVVVFSSLIKSKCRPTNGSAPASQHVINKAIVLDNANWNAFVHVAVFQHEDCTSFGAVFEDPDDGFLKAISGFQEGVELPDILEAIALREVLLHVKDHLRNGGSIFIDCQRLFFTLYSNSLDVSEFNLIVKDCMNILESRPSVKV
ncbi:uncharacterized protein LOC110626051 [Manihot esculenta]|uniref:uncharacterized protein LOC110626051 n=1 Tax=Manihot esculenta TaxID=3983 RepID=UPI000B5D74EB|nr:uncharacterized protein LOC110626051 [Manihot esculenta]